MGIETILICTLIGIAVSAAVMLYKKSKLKSVRFERGACNYVRQKSFKLTGSKDLFLFSNVIRIPRPSNNNTSRRR